MGEKKRKQILIGFYIISKNEAKFFFRRKRNIYK